MAKRPAVGVTSIFAVFDLAQCAELFGNEKFSRNSGEHQTQENIMLFRITKVALVATVLVAGAASTPALAVSARSVTAGETWARQMLTLMDTDKNGKVSRQEWMRFMEAEFDRLDVDHNGELSVQELSRFPHAYGAHPGPHR